MSAHSTTRPGIGAQQPRRPVHIVVGADGYDGGRDAIALGVALGAAIGARVSLVQAFPTPLVPEPGVTERPILRRRAEASLAADRKALAPGASTNAIADSSPARALAHFAEREHAGVVVIGSSATAEEHHVSFGRHGHELANDTQFALAVAARGLNRAPVSLTRIGVGFDGSPESNAALIAAARVAASVGGKLVVATVVEPSFPLSAATAGLPIVDVDRNSASDRDDALDYAQAVVARLGIGADVRAWAGDPSHELVGLSEDVDLLVLGSRRRGALARILAGSTAHYVLARAASSVLIVPRRPADATKRATDHW